MLVNQEAEQAFVNTWYVTPATMAVQFLNGQGKPNELFDTYIEEQSLFLSGQIEAKNAEKNAGKPECVVQSTNSNDADNHARYVQSLKQGLAYVARYPFLLQKIRDNAQEILAGKDGSQQLQRYVRAALFERHFDGEGFLSNFAKLTPMRSNHMLAA